MKHLKNICRAGRALFPPLAAVSLVIVCCLAQRASSQADPINARRRVCSCRQCVYSGARWLDTENKTIHAHGGGILKHADTYYWVGESDKGATAAAANVTCYSSKNLVQWKFERFLLTREDIRSELDEPDITIVERPKLARAAGNTWVLVMHLDYGDLSYARLGVAAPLVPPKNPCAERYWMVTAYRPAGQESRSIDTYEEGNATYLLFSSGHVNTHFTIGRFLPDFSQVVMLSNIPGRLEGPSLIKTAWGEYWLFLSLSTGWLPNEGRVFRSRSLSGPWLPNGTLPHRSFNSQPASQLQLAPHKWLYLADRWNYPRLHDASYVWLPYSVYPGIKYVGLLFLRCWRMDAFINGTGPGTAGMAAVAKALGLAAQARATAGGTGNAGPIETAEKMGTVLKQIPGRLGGRVGGGVKRRGGGGVKWRTGTGGGVKRRAGVKRRVGAGAGSGGGGRGFGLEAVSGGPDGLGNKVAPRVQRPKVGETGKLVEVDKGVQRLRGLEFSDEGREADKAGGD